MARDATARLYDVDDLRLKFEKMHESKKYDMGTIAFRAKSGKLIDLAKLHESIWATRLSGGTRSGVVCLHVTAEGETISSGEELVLDVRGGDRRGEGQFVLVEDVKAKPSDAEPSAHDSLRAALARGAKVVGVTGYVEGWSGRWPDVLRKPPEKRPRLMVTGFQIAGETSGEGQR